jgi:hypothetical protein
MADPQDLPRAAPTHHPDHRFNAILGWSIAWSAIPASIFAGSILGWSTGQLTWQGALPAMVGSVAVMAVINLYGYKQKAPKVPELKNPGPVMLFIALLTWCFVAWQSWMWFHPPAQVAQPVQPTQSAQSYTKAQLDEAVAKAKQGQLEQDKKDAAQQSTDAVANATAPLRAQIAQLQSDKPVSVDKLPTSLRVLFNSDGTYSQLDQKNIAAWEPINLLDPGGLLVRPPPVRAFVIVFKKPIAFDDVQIDGHNTGMIGKATTTDPAFIIVSFNYSLVGLVDIAVQNKHK